MPSTGLLQAVCVVGLLHLHHLPHNNCTNGLPQTSKKDNLLFRLHCLRRIRSQKASCVPTLLPIFKTASAASALPPAVWSWQQRKKDLLSALVVAQDPEGCIPVFPVEYARPSDGTLNRYFADILAILLGRISAASTIWNRGANTTNKRKRADDGGADDASEGKGLEEGNHEDDNEDGDEDDAASRSGVKNKPRASPPDCARALSPAWDHAGRGSITDFRRGGHDGLFPAVRHGDVYELVTSDPVARPLPDLRLLEIQFDVHKLMAGMRPEGALRVIFSGDPPDDDGPPIPSSLNLDVPPHWRHVLDAAVDAGVLDDTAARLWGLALTRFEYQRLINMAENDDDHHTGIQRDA